MLKKAEPQLKGIAKKYAADEETALLWASVHADVLKEFQVKVGGKLSDIHEIQALHKAIQSMKKEL